MPRMLSLKKLEMVKNKVEDEYTKKMFKGFTERVKMLEKKMLAENKRGGRRKTRKSGSRKN